MPDHAHLVIARHQQSIETLANQLKGAATRQLINANLHPFADKTDAKGNTPSPWAHGQWKVFIHSTDQLANTIRYVNQNPIKAGLKPQHWKFVHPPTT